MTDLDAIRHRQLTFRVIREAGLGNPRELLAQVVLLDNDIEGLIAEVEQLRPPPPDYDFSAP